MVKGSVMHTTYAPAGVVRIGPNSIIQTVGALNELYGAEAARAILERIGHSALNEQLPTDMVDEHVFMALINALRTDLGFEATGKVLARSGERTADYLLANRIPAPIRILLPWLPASLGLRIFLKAIAGHAWTFAGSGRFSYVVGRRGATICLADSPECRGIATDAPLCHYYTHCFQTLLRPLINPQLMVRETACGAMGADACTFEVTIP